MEMREQQGRATVPADAGPVPDHAPSLEGLGVAGITRRRAAFLLGTFVTIWIVAVFARQIGQAATMSRTADEVRAQNAALQAEISGLQDELDRVGGIAFVAQQARAFGVGSGRERPFALDPSAPALAPDAPGSASVRLGAAHETHSPLETWLSLLFGADRS